MESEIEKLGTISVNSLKSGDIILSAFNENQSHNIADSTKGMFSHAGLYLYMDKEERHFSLDTGPNGASIQELDINSPSGMAIIRTSATVDPDKLKSKAESVENLKYEFRRLFFIGLCAWDRRCYENNYGFHKLLKKFGKEGYLQSLNRRGSKNVCSGLTLSVLQHAASEQIMENCIFNLDQLSPNCIFEHAVKNKNKNQLFMLKNFSKDSINRSKKHFTLASLMLLGKSGVSIKQ